MEEHGDQHRETEVAPALIAVHPAQQSIAVSVGSELRVFNLQEGCPATLVEDSEDRGNTNFHKDSIRAIRYGAKGKLFVSAGDDKLVKIWTTDSWRCFHTVLSEKRVSAVAISNDGLFVCFADKFGVVYVADVEALSNEASADKKGVPILAHYCSIITRVEFSPDGRFIVSADRDFKIRVTVFPGNPLNGAHEIQSFCLGHREFVSSFAFVCSGDHPQGFLVSGGGDSTVRLWDFTTGCLLDTCTVGEQGGFLESEGRQDDALLAVTDLCTSHDGSSIAVAIQSLPGVMLLSCNLSAKTLSIIKVISNSEETFVPTSIGSSSTEQLLWMVMGVSSLNSSDSTSLARVRVLSGFGNSDLKSAEHETLILDDKDVPGGEVMLKKLQGTLSIEKQAYAAAAEAVKTAMRNLLIKKQYTEENRENRKRGRNDKKIRQG